MELQHLELVTSTGVVCGTATVRTCYVDRGCVWNCNTWNLLRRQGLCVDLQHLELVTSTGVVCGTATLRTYYVDRGCVWHCNT